MAKPKNIGIGLKVTLYISIPIDTKNAKCYLYSKKILIDVVVAIDGQIIMTP